MKFLDGDYELEDGRGFERNGYLKDHQIESYLIIPGEQFRTVNFKIQYKNQIKHICKIIARFLF